MLARILCAVDLSEYSRRALEHAFELASRTGARLEVLHAYYLPQEVGPTFVAWMPVAPHSPGDVLEKQAADRVNEFLASFPEAATREVKVHLVRAEPTSAILAFVEQERPDLLVIGTHGRSGWSRWLLGSVAQNLVRSAPCPVLTVPRPLTDGTSPAANKRGFQRILVAVDFSSCARAALLHASELARHFGASLEVVHAWDIAPVLAPDVTLGGGMASPTLASAAIEEARSAMSEFVRVAGESGVRIDHAHLERGPAARVIIDLVARANYDLLAIGTHGRSGISRLLLGSVAEQVVRRSTRPVLSVRAA